MIDNNRQNDDWLESAKTGRSNKSENVKIIISLAELTLAMYYRIREPLPDPDPLSK